MGGQVLEDLLRDIRLGGSGHGIRCDFGFRFGLSRFFGLGFFYFGLDFRFGIHFFSRLGGFRGFLSGGFSTAKDQGETIDHADGELNLLTDLQAADYHPLVDDPVVQAVQAD